MSALHTPGPGRLGVSAYSCEKGKWDTTAATAGPLIVRSTGSVGGSFDNNGSTFSVAKADTLANHLGRLLVCPTGRLGNGLGDDEFYHDYIWTGLNTSSATFGDPVYLQDTAVPPALTAGTIPRVVGYVAYAGAAQTAANETTCGAVRLCSPRELRGIWVQRQAIQSASSANPSAGTSAQAFDATLSIPTRRLFHGVKTRFRAVINVGGVNASDTHTFALLVGGTALVTSAAVNPASGDKCILEGEVTVFAAIGATAAVKGSGTYNFKAVAGANGMATNATQATNAAITVSVTATYSSSNSSNTSTLQELSIEYVDPIGT